MFLKPLNLVVAACLLLAVTVAQADDYSDVNKLMRINHWAEALNKADQFLANKPRDPQMRFMRGAALSELGRNSEAINAFTRLTEDYPELPEPYNNLAVLYANANQLDKARAALEMAIRTNPSYSTAHENLGDIYAKLASQAYGKALQIDTTNTAITPKLALIKELFAPNTRALSAIAPSVTPPAVLPVAPSNVNPIVAPMQSKPVSVVTSSPTGSNSPSVAPAVVSNAIAERDVEATVNNWAKAWSGRDMKAYLGSYAASFNPNRKLSRLAWEDERKVRIMGKAHISVKLSDLKVSVNGNTATAKFKQTYKADALSTSSHKTLELVKNGERWLISQEISG